jgi:hypothetical protein
MTHKRAIIALVLIVVGAAADTAVAGRGKKAECYLKLDGIAATGQRPQIDCRDGEPCDADGVADGACTFRFNVCAFQPDGTLPECTPQPVSGFKVVAPSTATILTPPVPVEAPACAEPSTVVVPLPRRGRGKAKVQCTSDDDCAHLTSGCDRPCTACRQRNPGAFAQGPARTIIETGTPAGDLRGDRLEHDATLAGVFCIPPLFNGTVDATADLPGPGAVALRGRMQVLPTGP